MTRFLLSFVMLFALARNAEAQNLDAPPKPDAKPGVWARVTLLAPRDADWRTHIITHLPGKQIDLYAGLTVSDKAENVLFLRPASASPWIDLSPAIPNGVASVRFLFETKKASNARDKSAQKPGIEARFDIASAPNDAAIVRRITERDTGDVIALRIPADLAKDKKWLLSIREDTQRRLREVQQMPFGDGPLPRKIWTMTGFRSNGQFYSDPAIAEMDFDIIKRLGMNGFWEQNGGQPGDLRKMAARRDINRSTVYWRAVASIPGDTSGALPMKWSDIDKYIDTVYRASIENTRRAHPNGMPEIIADLMDEPAGNTFDGPEYQAEFQGYLRAQNFTPEFFGQKSWNEVKTPRFGWREYFPLRLKTDLNNVSERRRLYWALKFWNHSVARLYGLATRKVEEVAPGVGTRVNFGPPWFYDYGTLPRGIDAFEFGRLRGVSLGFNEDWTGSGSARLPLEINTLLMDWSRAAARPATPLLGSYITRDANRNTVKLRTFGALAREAKIFDFYYYGPAYTFFDHWSDNVSMVQGIGELTRDIGAVDDILWEGRAPKAQVALLYSGSWPVWKEDDTEQSEQMMTYLALLHAGIPVDFVSDEEVADGRFAARGYKALYVVNESIPTVAATEIARWVEGGGKLWAQGWAGARDEYNTPSEIWNAMLGITKRDWKPTGDLKRLGEQIEPADWKRPRFSRVANLQAMPGATHQTLDFMQDQSRALIHKFGAGEVQIVPWTAGQSYIAAAQESEKTLGHAVVYPTGALRDVFVQFALNAKVQPTATTSQNQILAWPLWTQKNGVVLIANFTGEAAKEVAVQFYSPIAVAKLRSLKHGNIAFTKDKSGIYNATLPVFDVTDIIVVE